jgi:hypothetical protein
MKAGGAVFQSPRPDSLGKMNALLKQLKHMGRGDITAHGFRSTFRDWAADLTERGC